MKWRTRSAAAAVSVMAMRLLLYPSDVGDQGADRIFDHEQPAQFLGRCIELPREVSCVHRARGLESAAREAGRGQRRSRQRVRTAPGAKAAVRDPIALATRLEADPCAAV